MAHVNFDGLNLRITLAPAERRAVHRKELVLPRSSIASVTYSRNLWDQMQHKITLLGLGYPGIIAWGTAATREGRDFCLVGKPGPGLVIGLRDHPFSRVLVTMPDNLAWPLFARLREITTDNRGSAAS